MTRKRAVNVCEFCHKHKVRCNVDSTGIPCAKCIEIGKGCKIRARKQYSSRKRARRSSSTRSDNDGDYVMITTPSPRGLDSIKIVAAAIPEPSPRIAPIFVGEGGYGAILDATGETTGRLFYVPATAEKALAAEDLEYLKVKGCFTLPVESKELLKAYFRFVHPTFPVIHGPLFLQEYAARGHEGINLLLLWSMFSVSANYISISSKRASKEIYANRAKLLFDLSQETDKIVLVQSALLLSFWFADTEDVKQSWYWTSIAFGIAQTLGLHREVRSAHTQVTVQQRSLWRSIWQCCMIRDVWLAFGMGRPLRIKASDCDCPMPDDSDSQFTDLALHDEELYSPGEAAGLLHMWQSLITTSHVLRSIMTSKSLSPWQVKSFEDRINVQSINSSTLLFTLVDRHLKLHQYATIIALARANGSKEGSRKAADSTTAIIQAFLDDNTTMYAAPVTVPLVVPAMVTYLTAIKSARPEARKSENDKLNLYSQFLSTIEDNHPAASILKRVFAAAQDAIVSKGAGRGGEEVTLSRSIDQFSSSWDMDWLRDESSPWLAGCSGSIEHEMQ